MSGKISRIHIGGPQRCKVLKWFYSLTIETPLSEVHVLYRVAFQFVCMLLLFLSFITGAVLTAIWPPGCKDVNQGDHSTDNVKFPDGSVTPPRHSAS